ncbi:hypothetical protein GUJ93_ZPchr0328g33303 [Zizania palustris]|uniref:APO domain-containing protein n=1 Tax=Zizania palustris TaxID=103762 RepID=A0A8J5QYX7_ZIZPA|nr:hypothetical protein GUJ93_ZPchr0328g33303 [Zizania palustris]
MKKHPSPVDQSGPHNLIRTAREGPEASRAHVSLPRGSRCFKPNSRTRQRIGLASTPPFSVAGSASPRLPRAAAPAARPAPQAAASLALAPAVARSDTPRAPSLLAGVSSASGLGLGSGPETARQIATSCPARCVCAAMALVRRRLGSYICSELCGPVMNQRLYSSRVDWKQLRPMILKRIKNRANDYPIKRMIPIAREVFNAREIVTRGVSTLLQVVPVHSCKFCPEVHIGAVGHQMKSCYGFKRMIKDRAHEWGPGCLNDILVPVESFHLENTFQDEIKHDQRFDFTRVPAVLELCHQAGADIPDEVMHTSGTLSATVKGHNDREPAAFLPEDLRFIGHKARMCGVFKYEGWRGKHKWKAAGVDDLVPPKIVWHQRPHDPPVLVDTGRDYYGHAPAVIELYFVVVVLIWYSDQLLVDLHWFLLDHLPTIWVEGL